MNVLTKREAKILHAIGRTLFPREGAIGADVVDAGVVQYIDNYLAKLSLFDRIRIRALFQLFDLGIAVTMQNPAARLSTADAEERVEYLRGWEQSPIYVRRMAFAGIRSVFFLAYFGSRDVSAEFGFDLDSEPTMDAHLTELARLSTRIKPNTVAVPAYIDPTESVIPAADPESDSSATDDGDGHTPTEPAAPALEADSVDEQADVTNDNTTQANTDLTDTGAAAAASSSPRSS